MLPVQRTILLWKFGGGGYDSAALGVLLEGLGGGACKVNMGAHLLLVNLIFLNKILEMAGDFYSFHVEVIRSYEASLIGIHYFGSALQLWNFTGKLDRVRGIMVWEEASQMIIRFSGGWQFGFLEIGDEDVDPQDDGDHRKNLSQNHLILINKLAYG